MLTHYLTTAFRNFVRNKFYTTITVVGLAFGITSVFLIIQYLKSELSYDRFHEGSENIYRVAWFNINPQTRTPHPMAQAMVQDFPEVESAVSLTPLWGPGLTKEVFSIRNIEKDQRFDESGVLAVDSTFFKVFPFSLIKGDARTALKDPGGVLISESTAMKYFGTVDCLGKQLQANDEKYLIQVTGVFKDVPAASHFHFDFLVSYVREKLLDPGDPYYQWADFGHYNYVRLKPGADAKELEKKLLGWSRKYVNFSDEDFRWLNDHKYGFQLQPITSIHLQSHLRWELEPNGNIAYVYLMSAAALLILIIGAVNFVNLNMAQASERAKEIGLRKSLGAFRQQLISQFLGESILITLMAIVLSIVLIEVSLPLFYSLTGKVLAINRGIFFVALLSLGLVVALVTGIYPALFMSAAKPALILKNKMFQTSGVGTRRAFIVFQFVASMGLISASAIISQQLDFLQRKDLGFNPEEVLVIPIKDREMNRRIPELRNELMKVAGVTSVSATSNIPGKSFNQNTIFTTRNPEERRDASEVMVDADFAKVMNINMTEGRFFSSSPADSSGFVLNQTAINQLGVKDPIGKVMVWERDGPMVKGPIIGVVEDFNFQSLHEPVKPLLMFMEPRFNFAVVKVNTSDFRSTIGAIEKIWRKFDNRFQFEFSFLNAQLNQLYAEEQNVVSVLKVFSLLGVIIASLGLLGIAALTFRQRTKEISVRKVLGATLSNLVILLVKDFTRLVLIAVVLAVPVVWWIMNGWLENFSYRITVSPFVFVFTGLGLIAISWLTLSFLTFKTAQVNPAETLKSE